MQIKGSLIATLFNFFKNIEGQKFARKCSVTGEGMDEGYVFDWNDFLLNMLVT